MNLIRTFLVTLILYSVQGYSQPQKNLIAIGGEIGFPAHQPFQSNKAIGMGINIKGEHFFSNKFSSLASIGFSSFSGKIVYWDGAEDKDFSLIPILVGGRFHIKKFYLGLESGIAISASNNTNSLFAIAPSIGIVHGHFDLVAKLFAIPEMPSIPENTFLQKGGYSYLNFGVNYNFNLRKHR